MTKDQREVSYSQNSVDYVVDGEHLEVLIYKTDRNPCWTLEVVNSNGSSTLWEEPFIAAGLALRVFVITVEEEDVRPFLDEDDPRKTMH